MFSSNVFEQYYFTDKYRFNRENILLFAKHVIINIIFVEHRNQILLTHKPASKPDKP